MKKVASRPRAHGRAPAPGEGSERVRRHFDREARTFDALIRRLVPGYAEMLEALVGVLPFARGRALEVLDLGCGTGTIGGLVLEVWPRACVTCVDISERMLEVARAKLEACSCARFHAADFARYALDRRYDAVLSSLAIHHLRTGAEKRALFRRIRASLRPGGVFWNADVVRASEPHLDRVSLEAWVEFMRRSVSEREIRRKWLPTHRREDRPAVLVDQLAWLRRAGFSGVDVIWRSYGFAVYGGTRA